MSDNLDRKIAESLEPFVSLPSLEWYEDGIVDESAYSPLGYWYTARHYEEGDILHWEPVNFKLHRPWQMLLDHILRNSDWEFFLSNEPNGRASIELVPTLEAWDRGVRGGCVRQFPIEDLPDQIRLAYAVTRGISV